MMQTKNKFHFGIVIIIDLILAAVLLMQLHLRHENDEDWNTTLILLDALMVILCVSFMFHFLFVAQRFYHQYSQMRHFQQKMTAISEQNQIYYMQYDVAKRTFYDWNPKTLELTKDFDVNEFYRRIHPVDMTIAKKLVRYILDGEKQLYTCELRFKFPELTKYSWQDLEVFPYDTDKHGNPTCYIGVFKNVDDKHQYTDELERMYQRAESASKMKTALIQNMSHEIRTPLNAILGFTQLLSADLSKEDYELFMGIIKENTQQLVHIINDILSLSVLEHGDFKFNRMEFDISAFMQDLTDTLKREIHPGVALQLVQHPSFKVHLDNFRLSEAIQILVQNANKFTVSGTITVDYHIGGGMLTVSVADTGIGIKTEDQERIFQRFVKLDPFSQGLGMGLSICRSLLDRAGGTISVASEPEKGSTFTFSVPYWH